jgi:hypothetical protein
MDAPLVLGDRWLFPNWRLWTEMLYRPTLFDIARVASVQMLVVGKLMLGGNPVLFEMSQAFHLLYTSCTARAVIYSNVP